MDLLKERSLRIHRELAKTLVIPTLIVLAALLAVTLWSWSSARSSLARDTENEVAERSQNITSAITDRMRSYEEILRGGVGLFNASKEVNRDDWRRYVGNFDISERYPGVQGIGYAHVFGARERNRIVSEMRQSGLQDFTVHPEGPRDVYASILFLEPMDERNRLAIGYDMYSEEIRRKAMDAARDSGQPVLSGRVQLVQEGGSPNPQSGFLMYMPVYQTGAPVSGVMQRRQALEGYVYAPFRASDLFEKTFSGTQDERVGFRIYARDVGGDNLLYTNASFDKIPDKGSHRFTESISLNGIVWHIQYKMSPDIISGRDRFRPISTLLWGVLISFVVAYGVYRLLNHRAMTLAQAQATEVQLAKDDLLSLASHQLRTPATGVKQYIGMLREGYAGTLTADQRAFLDMAYESNERQLHIINELLYVAKADSGRIVLAKRRLSINRLVREVADEHKSAFAESQHKLKLRLPHRDVMIVADSHCLRMALDNLVSNAIKYTPEGGLVEIAVRVDETHVHIAVKDSGVGIDRSQMPNLFKRFSRIPNELSEQSGGSGIGLYLARHLVNLHKGDITVESEVGKGTCFTIQLPLEGTPD